MKNWLGIFLVWTLSMGLFAPSIAHSSEVDPDFIIDREDYDSKQPRYQVAKSSWAVALKAGMNGFPTSSANGDLAQIYVDWILPYQKLGVFSTGPNLGILSLKDPTGSLIYPNGNPMIGAHLGYQLKVTPNQWVVPTASLSFDYYRLKPKLLSFSTASGTILSSIFGIMINLGWIDSQTAKEAYQALGMTKAYLTAEMQMTNFENTLVSMNAKFYLLGLRLEFE